MLRVEGAERQESFEQSLRDLIGGHVKILAIVPHRPHGVGAGARTLRVRKEASTVIWLSLCVRKRNK